MTALYIAKELEDCTCNWFDPGTAASLLSWVVPERRGWFKGLRHGQISVMQCSINEFEILRNAILTGSSQN